MMLIRNIKLNNLLSFGPDTTSLKMEPLNVLIGPNGAGKSNFIEIIGLLKAMPKDITVPIREGGGIGNWIWRGESKDRSAKIEVEIDNPMGLSMKGSQALRYMVAFAESGQRFELTDELIEGASSHPNPPMYYKMRKGAAMLKYRGEGEKPLPEGFGSRQSILSQRKDPEYYPELTYLGEALNQILLYREWTFGRNSSLRMPQKTDHRNDFLEEDGKNLGLIVSSFKRNPKVKERVRGALQNLYEGVSDFDIIIEGGTVQVFLQEGDITVPATRLSDGTLRYLCLLMILCHPEPPPLVCIEEPELGLHPDILPTLSELLREASKRCQLVVTTHSDVLVDALTDTPESVVVCEKHDGRTSLRRLDKEDLSDWLERYTLGDLWTRGEIGGNRW
ncbi:AAA family ATPase [Thioalkalivibrio sp. HK1]|uniref:AAA family ATPase n=1 Tax=Thioalkalivibrio sp. HK1 TaxID=1469245 RepID=UPI0004B61194|nr:AAA family ATPase [Thioalkalivibrio sp. HK1]